MEAADTNFARGVQVPTWLGVERRNVASGTLAGTVKHGLAPLGCFFVEASRRRRGCRDSELIQMQ